MSACATVGNLETEGVRTTIGNSTSHYGCTFNYTLRHPVDLANRQSVSALIGHGFLRDKKNMAVLAEQLARNGITTATLNFCNMKFWNGHHLRNARDMQDLARELKFDSTIYIGFSAGALAALAAGAADDHAIGVVTLDLVDQNKIVANAQENLDIPVFALFGSPSKCNRQSEAINTLQNHVNVTIESVNTASHCEFESPTNFLCELFCGDNDKATDNNATREAIIHRVVQQVSELVEDKN